MNPKGQTLLSKKKKKKRPDTFGHTHAASDMAALHCHYTSIKASNQIPGTARLDVQNSKNNQCSNNQIHIHWYLLFFVLMKSVWVSAEWRCHILNLKFQKTYTNWRSKHESYSCSHVKHSRRNWLQRLFYFILKGGPSPTVIYF